MTKRQETTRETHCVCVCVYEVTTIETDVLEKENHFLFETDQLAPGEFSLVDWMKFREVRML